MPLVSSEGPTVFGWIVRAWYTSRKASARIFQLQSSSTRLVSIIRSGAAATSGRRPGSGASHSSNGIGVGVEVHEPPAAPLLAANGRQRPLLLLETDEVPLVGHPHQVAAQVVAPRVELADQHAGLAALAADDRCAAVAAGVVERTDLTVVIPRQEDGCADDVAELVAAGSRELGVVARVEPDPLEQVLVLELLERRIGVAAQREVRQLGEAVGRPLTSGLVGRTLPETGEEIVVHRSPPTWCSTPVATARRQRCHAMRAK